MANNPPITDKFHDYITTNLDLPRLVKILDRRITYNEKYLESQAKNEFEGELLFRVVGNKKTIGLFEPSETPPFSTATDINHPSADPFRDPDVDESRIISRGLIDRDTIEKRNIIFLQNKELANILFLAETEEERGNLATFLIRVPHKGEEQPSLERGSRTKFSFRDPSSMRDPYVVLAKEKDQAKSSETPEAKGNKK